MFGRISDFDKLWAGQSVSLLGSALTLFALPTLAILVLHATPIEVGTLEALQTLPFPILGIAIGVLADRWPRRRIMIVADLARFASLASVPVSAFFGVLHLPQLDVVALVTGTCSAFFGIAYQSYLPVVVRKDELTRANVKLEFSNSGASMAGSALAGALVQVAGAATAIAVDAASYLASVASLQLVRAREPAHHGPTLTLRQASREVGEGFRAVLDTANLRWIAAATATTNFGISMVGAVAFVYAYGTLHVAPGALGVVFGLAEIGFVGALLSSRVRSRFGLRTTLVGALALSAIGTSVMLVAQFGAPYVALFAAAAIGAFAAPIYNVNQVSYRQASVDVRLQGRVNATMRTLVWGTLPLGSFVGGWLASTRGAPTAILIGAGISFLAAFWLIPVCERVRDAGAEDLSRSL